MVRQASLPPKMTEALKNQGLCFNLLKAGQRITEPDRPIENTSRRHNELKMPLAITEQKVLGSRQPQDGGQRSKATDIESVFAIRHRRLDVECEHG